MQDLLQDRGECTRSHQSCRGGGQRWLKKGCSQQAGALQHFRNTLPFPPDQIVPAPTYLLPSQRQNKALHGISLVHFSVTLENNQQFDKKKNNWQSSNSQLGFGRHVQSVKGDQRLAMVRGLQVISLYFYPRAEEAPGKMGDKSQSP